MVFSYHFSSNCPVSSIQKYNFVVEHYPEFVFLLNFVFCSFQWYVISDSILFLFWIFWKESILDPGYCFFLSKQNLAEQSCGESRQSLQNFLPFIKHHCDVIHFFFFHWNSSLNLVRQHLSFSLCSRILLKPS